ncbi:uncharacterized protein VTP21DRAFT_3670 [Calcarisporiella thermophila]|uniref:uncharacterized protein n=1 Tax=Calcarisporiella thermophila TaxID=911321 RepID=UPI0037426564
MDKTPLPPGVPDLTLKEQWQNDFVFYSNVILNSLGLACGLIVVFIIIGLGCYNRKLVDRVSLRLTAAISFVDALKAIAFLIYTFYPVSGWVCDFAAWSVVWLTLLYSFLTDAIAINLQLVFLHGRPYRQWWEYWYWGVPILASLIISIPPYALNHLGFDLAQQLCWYKDSHTQLAKNIEWATYLFWVMGSCVYCTVVVILVIIKLQNSARELASMSQTPRPNTELESRFRKTQKTLHKLIRRIALYPLIPFITQMGFCICELWMHHRRELNFGIDVWSVWGTDIPGILNLIAFSLDPAVHNSFNTIKNDLIAKYGHEEQPYPLATEHKPRQKTMGERIGRFIVFRILKADKNSSIRDPKTSTFEIGTQMSTNYYQLESNLSPQNRSHFQEERLGDTYAYRKMVEGL